MTYDDYKEFKKKNQIGMWYDKYNWKIIINRQ
jgi:hypothetical protein